MSTKRRLSLASLALLVAALGASGIARADVFLTEPAGTKIATGAKVTITAGKSLQFTGTFDTVTCGAVSLEYEVMTNGPEHVVLNPVSTHNGLMQNCEMHTAIGSFTATIANAGTQQLTINTWGTAVVQTTFTFSAGAPFNIHCSYTGNLHLSGTIGTDTLHAPGSTLTAPGCGNAQAHGPLTLDTPDATPIVLDAAKTP